MHSYMCTVSVQNNSFLIGQVSICAQCACPLRGGPQHTISTVVCPCASSIFNLSTSFLRPDTSDATIFSAQKGEIFSIPITMTTFKSRISVPSEHLLIFCLTYCKIVCLYICTGMWHLCLGLLFSIMFPWLLITILNHGCGFQKHLSLKF